jgi:hypothetical protein
MREGKNMSDGLEKVGARIPCSGRIYWEVANAANNIDQVDVDDSSATSDVASTALAISMADGMILDTIIRSLCEQLEIDCNTVGERKHFRERVMCHWANQDGVKLVLPTKSLALPKACTSKLSTTCSAMGVHARRRIPGLLAHVQGICGSEERERMAVLAVVMYRESDELLLRYWLVGGVYLVIGCRLFRVGRRVWYQLWS